MKKKLYNIIKWKREIHEIVYTYLLRSIFFNIGINSRIRPSVKFYNPDKISVGMNSIIKEGVILDGRSNRNIGIEVRDNVIIRANSYLDCYGGNGHIVLDNYAQIGQQVIIGGNGGVHIGKYAMVSGMTYIVSATHDCDINIKIPYYLQGEKRKPIVIEDNVWIASQCMIFCGVTIGENSIIGANSVVTKSIPPNCFAFGAPAKVHRKLKPSEQNKNLTFERKKNESSDNKRENMYST